MLWTVWILWLACAVDTDDVMSTRTASEQAKKEEVEALQLLKQAQAKAGEIEAQLAAARLEVTRLTKEHAEKKKAADAAQQAVFASYATFTQDIAADVPEVADLMAQLGNIMGRRAGLDMSDFMGAKKPKEPKAPKPPAPAQKVLVYPEKNFGGTPTELTCCGSFEASGRSYFVPEGLEVTVFSRGKDRVTLVGSSAQIEDHAASWSFLAKSLEIHSIDTSSLPRVTVTTESGKKKSYIQGDYSKEKLGKLLSIEVPAGMKVSLFDSEKFEGFIDLLTLDKDLESIKHHVRSLKVSAIPASELHGAYVYPEPGFGGRAQFYFVGVSQLPGPIGSVNLTNSITGFLYGGRAWGVESGTVPEDLRNATQLQLDAHCEPHDYCGAHGVCVAPPRGCKCSLDYRGERCNQRFPDETSAIFCAEHNVLVGDSVPCTFVPRRNFEQVTTFSVYIRLKGTDLSGSPITKQGYAGPRDEEASSYDFVWTPQTAGANDWKLTVLNREQDMFIPTVTAVHRCKAKSLTVQCASDFAVGEPIVCTVAALDAQGVPLQCPLRQFTINSEDGQVSGLHGDMTFTYTATRSGAVTLSVYCLLDKGLSLTASTQVEPRSGFFEKVWNHIRRGHYSIAEKAADGYPHLLSKVRLLRGDTRGARQAIGDQASEDMLESISSMEKLWQDGSLEALGLLLKMSPGSSDIRMARMRQAFHAGKPELVRQDAAHVRPSVEAFLILGWTQVAYYAAWSAGRENALRCLQIDAGSSECKALKDAAETIVAWISAAESFYQQNDMLALSSLAQVNVDASFLGTTTVPAVDAAASRYKCIALFSLRNSTSLIEVCSAALAPPLLRDLWPAEDSAALLVARAWGRWKDGDKVGALDDLNTADMMAQLAASRLLREEIMQADEPVKEDWYDILGIDKTATQDEVKQAYRKKALQWHPDKNSSPDAPRMFLLVRQAYQILSDPELRKQYDGGEDVEVKDKNNDDVVFAEYRMDREAGKMKVKWRHVQTGEEGWIEVEIPVEEPKERVVQRKLPDHYCLPA